MRCNAGYVHTGAIPEIARLAARIRSGGASLSVAVSSVRQHCGIRWRMWIVCRRLPAVLTDSNPVQPACSGALRRRVCDIGITFLRRKSECAVKTRTWARAWDAAFGPMARPTINTSLCPVSIAKSGWRQASRGRRRAQIFHSAWNPGRGM